MHLQRLLRAIYPDQCLSCGVLTDAPSALCAECWSKTGFIFGSRCDACGTSLVGPAAFSGDKCDDCLRAPPPWSRGRAAVAYKGLGKDLVLGMKYGDKPGHARPFARWMARAGSDILDCDTLLVPVPLHWTRLAKRRFNQSAELARGVVDATGAAWCPDALFRRKRTPPLGDASRPERDRILASAIAVNPRRAGDIYRRNIVLVDDVLTTGATLSACTEVCLDAGARRVCVLVLARAGKTH